MNLTKDAIEFILQKFPTPAKDIKTAYSAGYDCEKNGANIINCHFSIFHSEAHLAAWNEGKADAEAGKPNKYSITQNS